MKATQPPPAYTPTTPPASTYTSPAGATPLSPSNSTAGGRGSTAAPPPSYMADPNRQSPQMAKHSNGTLKQNGSFSSPGGSVPPPPPTYSNNDVNERRTPQTKKHPITVVQQNTAPTPPAYAHHVGQGTRGGVGSEKSSAMATPMLGPSILTPSNYSEVRQSLLAGNPYFPAGSTAIASAFSLGAPVDQAVTASHTQRPLNAASEPFAPPGTNVPNPGTTVSQGGTMAAANLSATSSVGSGTSGASAPRPSSRPKALPPVVATPTGPTPPSYNNSIPQPQKSSHSQSHSSGANTPSVASPPQYPQVTPSSAVPTTQQQQQQQQAQPQSVAYYYPQQQQQQQAQYQFIPAPGGAGSMVMVQPQPQYMMATQQGWLQQQQVYQGYPAQVYAAPQYQSAYYQPQVMNSPLHPNATGTSGYYYNNAANYMQAAAPMYMVMMPDGTTAMVPADSIRPAPAMVATPTTPAPQKAQFTHGTPRTASPQAGDSSSAPNFATNNAANQVQTTFQPSTSVPTVSKNTTIPSIAPTLQPIVDSLRGRVLMAARDQAGCRSLQRVLAEAPFECEEVQLLLAEIHPMSELVTLMSEPYGNFFFQKLFEAGSDTYRLSMVQVVANELPKISTTTHGTFSVQKLVENLRSDEEKHIVTEGLSTDIPLLMIDVNGGHVVQKLLSAWPSPKDRNFLLKKACEGDNLTTIANDKQGCCIIQKCMDVATPEQLREMSHDVFRCFHDLVTDPFGNYVIQYFLDLYGNVVEASRLLRSADDALKRSGTTPITVSHSSFSVHSTPIKMSQSHSESPSPSHTNNANNNDAMAITSSGDRERPFSAIVNTTRYRKQREDPAFLAIADTDAAEFFNSAAFESKQRIVDMCENKFSSNVVEKLLHVCCEALGGGQKRGGDTKVSSNASLLKLGGEHESTKPDDFQDSSSSARPTFVKIIGCTTIAKALTTDQETLRKIVSNNYGNYVIQTAMRKVNLDELEVLLRQLIQLTPELKTLSFSKKLEVKIDFAIRRMGAEGRNQVASELFGLLAEASGSTHYYHGGGSKGNSTGRGGSNNSGDAEKSTTPLHGGNSSHGNSPINDHHAASKSTNSPLVSPQKHNSFSVSQGSFSSVPMGGVSGATIVTPTTRRRAAPTETLPPPPSYTATSNLSPQKANTMSGKLQPPTYGSSVSPQQQAHVVIGSGHATPQSKQQKGGAGSSSPEAFGVIGSGRHTPSNGTPMLGPATGIPLQGDTLFGNWPLPPATTTDNLPSLDAFHADVSPNPTATATFGLPTSNATSTGTRSPAAKNPKFSPTAATKSTPIKTPEEEEEEQRRRKNLEGVVFLSNGVNAPAFARYELQPTLAPVGGPIVSITNKQFTKEVRTAAAAGKPATTTGLWGLTDNHGRSIWQNNSAPSSGKQPTNPLAESSLFEDSVGSPSHLFSAAGVEIPPTRFVNNEKDAGTNKQSGNDMGESNSDQPLAGRSFADLLMSSGSDAGGGAVTAATRTNNNDKSFIPSNASNGSAKYAPPKRTQHTQEQHTWNRNAYHKDPHQAEPNVLDFINRNKAPTGKKQ